MDLQFRGRPGSGEWKRESASKSDALLPAHSERMVTIERIGGQSPALSISAPGLSTMKSKVVPLEMAPLLPYIQ